MPPCIICGKGELTFGGTLFVLSPPMRMPTSKKEHAATRPNAVSERQTDSRRTNVPRTGRERSRSRTSEAARPHRARRMTTDWNSSFMSPDPQLQRINRHPGFHAQDFRATRCDASHVPVGIEKCVRHNRRKHRGLQRLRLAVSI